MKNQFNFFRKVAPATGIAHTKAISTQRALSESVISAWFGFAHQPPLNNHRPRALSKAVPRVLSEVEAPRRTARIAAIIALCFAPLLAMAQNTVYAGLGMGLDYGGMFGAKIEYLPAKHFGIFGGLGYNLVSAGWNAGVTYKILPDKKVSPNLMAFYGYNGVSKADGAPEYEMTSYGATFGANVDIRVGGRGHKLSVGLFVPVRSSKFRDNYDALKNDPRIEVKSGLMSVLVSLGFNFALK